MYCSEDFERIFTFIPKFRELYKLKDERIARLRKEIDTMEKGERLFI